MTTREQIEALVGTQEAKVSLLTKTVVKMNKKSKEGVTNPFSQPIYKISAVNATLNKSYQEAVNEQRVDEGKQSDFQAQERKWGETDGCFVVKGQDLYLSCIVESTKTLRYEFEDGTEVDKEEFGDFLPTSSKPSSSTQGLDSEVKVRTFKMSSIQKIERV